MTDFETWSNMFNMSGDKDGGGTSRMCMNMLDVVREVTGTHGDLS